MILGYITTFEADQSFYLSLSVSLKDKHFTSQGLVVKALDSQSRGPMFKTTGSTQPFIFLVT